MVEFGRSALPIYQRDNPNPTDAKGNGKGPSELRRGSRSYSGRRIRASGKRLELSALSALLHMSCQGVWRRTAAVRLTGSAGIGSFAFAQT